MRPPLVVCPVSALVSGNRGVHDLAYLPAGGVVARPELQAPRPAVVPRYYAPAIRGLHERVERVRRGHVPERGSGRRVYRPALGQRHYLGRLSPRDIISGPELQAPRAAAISRDDAP